jgi:hypothetical protein
MGSFYPPEASELAGSSAAKGVFKQEDADLSTGIWEAAHAEGKILQGCSTRAGAKVFSASPCCWQPIPANNIGKNRNGNIF